MKKQLYYLLLLGLLFGQDLSAQTATTPSASTNFHFELLVEAPIYECDILGNKLDSTVAVAPKGAIFTKVDLIGSNTLIRFWHWKNDAHLNETLYYADSTKTSKKYFLLSTDEFNMKAIPYLSKKPSFTVGATHIPFRLRFDPFDFSNHLSIGTSFGVRLPMSNTQDISFNLLGGINIASISLDSLSTNGMADAGETAPAFTPSLGAVFEYSKVQVGIYFGIDLLSGAEKDIWIYQGKPWISIGVGVSIFTADSGTSADPTVNDTQ